MCGREADRAAGKAIASALCRTLYFTCIAVCCKMAMKHEVITECLELNFAKSLAQAERQGLASLRYQD